MLTFWSTFEEKLTELTDTLERDQRWFGGYWSHSFLRSLECVYRWK